jgi:tRNA A-37 threonylcarbamoyl transferase component Bud32
VIEGYSKVLDAETVKNVLDKVEEIEKRGRYVSERRQRKA